MKIDALIIQRFSELGESSKKAMPRTWGDQMFQRWATNVLSLLQQVFGEDSIHYQNFYREYREYGPQGRFYFSNCLGIFLAAKEDYEQGYLFNVRALVKAEVLVDDVLAQAIELLNANFKDPACVLAGVALETTLKELCTRQGVPHSKLDQMNADLRKAGVYNMAKQKQITAWAELRNKAAHGQWSEYNNADVDSFIEGVTRFIADFL
jgi:hypothetical protein